MADFGRPIDGLRHLPWKRLIAVALALGGLFIVGQVAGEWIRSGLGLEEQSGSADYLRMVVAPAAAVYVILTAIPFVPGVEVGLSLLMLFGGSIALVVYVCTVLALMLAYLVGRFVPFRYFIRIFKVLALTRAAELLEEVANLPTRQRLAFLLETAPSGVVPFLLRHRYLTLAIIINMPGNMIVGGGGGIAMIAGMSGMFAWPAFLLTTAVAVAPVPLLVYFIHYSW